MRDRGYRGCYSQGPKGAVGWPEPGNPKFFSGEPGVLSLRCLEPYYYFTVEPGALKTFAAQPVAPNIKILTFLHTDSVIACFVCCVMGIGTKIVKNHAIEHANTLPLGNCGAFFPASRNGVC